MALTLTPWQRWRFERQANKLLAPVVYGLEERWRELRREHKVTIPPLDVWIIGRVVATPALNPRQLGHLIRIANSQNIELQTATLFYRVILTPDGSIKIAAARRKPPLIAPR